MGAVSESATTEPGTVGWTYQVANSATQYLAVGQTATEQFTVTVNDGHGGTVSQVVTVTVTGTNDAPTITVARRCDRRSDGRREHDQPSATPARSPSTTSTSSTCTPRASLRLRAPTRSAASLTRAA